jgi:hypothetical protein
MKENTLKEHFVAQCIETLRREDVKNEIKKFLKPFLVLIVNELYPYIYICLGLVIISFLLVLAIFIMVFKNKTVSLTIQ